MRISLPQVREDGPAVTLSADVEVDGRRKTVWYSVEREYAGSLTADRQDAFVLALLPIAMKRREDLHVEGLVSERLFYGLSNYYIRILSTAIRSLHPVRILPEGLATNRIEPAPAGVAAGFSGGVDSFCLLADHFYGDVPDGFRLTHLIYNNVGSHGRQGRRLFEQRYQRLLAAVRDLGLPFIKVDSNLDELVDTPFLQTHSLRNISVALVLQRLIRRFYYASAYKYEDCFVGETSELARCDPMAIHLLSTESTDCMSSGCQYSRVQKTERLAGLALSRRCLDVCVRSPDGSNCSGCWKCARTMLTLEILGRLDEYDGVFDLDEYRRIRYRYLSQVVSSDDALTREIVELARTRGFEFPAVARYYAWSRFVPLALRAPVKRLAARFGWG